VVEVVEVVEVAEGEVKRSIFVDVWVCLGFEEEECVCVCEV